jgi:hypothetical protein
MNQKSYSAWQSRVTPVRSSLQFSSDFKVSSMHPVGESKATLKHLPGLYQSSNLVVSCAPAHAFSIFVTFYLSSILPIASPVTCRYALTVLPRPVFHVHHARFCALSTRRSAALSLSHAHARTFAQCSGMQVRQLAQTAASGGCVDVDGGDECCIRSCACTGHVVHGSAQRGARRHCSYLSSNFNWWEHRHIRGW